MKPDRMAVLPGPPELNEINDLECQPGVTAHTDSKRQSGKVSTRRLTLYRDDSTVQVVYDGVKAVFWTAGNTVLVISQFSDQRTGAHRYIHWPRERFCWFKDDPRV